MSRTLVSGTPVEIDGVSLMYKELTPTGVARFQYWQTAQPNNRREFQVSSKSGFMQIGDDIPLADLNMTVKVLSYTSSTATISTDTGETSGVADLLPTSAAGVSLTAGVVALIALAVWWVVKR